MSHRIRIKYVTQFIGLHKLCKQEIDSVNSKPKTEANLNIYLNRCSITCTYLWKTKINNKESDKIQERNNK